MLRSIVIGIVLFAFANVVHSQEDYPFVPRVEDLAPLEEVFTTYRLPNTTRPESYDVTIRTMVHNEDFDFWGTVIIELTAINATNSITLHSRLTQIIEVTLRSSAGTELALGDILYDNTFEFLTVTTEQALTPGNTYFLEIFYFGTLRTDEGGFYRSSYLDDNGRRVWLATTQFESTDARHGFPCYDEPNLKATFKIRITHDPSYSAISNMPEVSQIENDDGTVTTEFEETPRMSTYLVAFIISDFGHLASANASREIPQRTFARPNAVHQSHLMLDAGEKILDALIDYFGVNYSLPKIDQAGIPDFSAGAMENWGLVTYRESHFFYIENVTTYITVLGSVKVIAHEYVHQWFGNLVSPTWWTYLWLNEGFARFVEHIGVNLVYPNWQMIDYFVARTLQNVFQSDALQTSRPMSQYVEHPNDIERQFSNIAYDKAGSVLRMFMNVFTEATFMKGLNLYLNRKSFSNAAEGDLFAALDSAVRQDNAIPTYIDVPTVMASWSQQAGFPVVTVTRNYDPSAAPQIVTFSQERYFTTPPTTPFNTTWWIPINYATEQRPNFDDTRADQWFPQNYELGDLTIFVWPLEPTDWFIVNKQAIGYFRVLYDEQNYRLLSDALFRNINVFHTLNRAQLVDDTYNFVRTERLRYDTFFNVVRFLEFEDEYAVWYPAITAFTTIDRYFGGHQQYPLFREYLRSLIEHLYDVVGVRDIPDEPHLRKYSRTIAINWACATGSSHCRSDATRELRALRENGGEFHQNVRDVLYCAALRTGTSNDFDFVLGRLADTDDVTTRNQLLNALGCSTSSRLLREYIHSSLNSTSDGDIVFRAGEPLRVFNAVYQNGLTGLETAIQFLIENAREAYTTYGSNNFGNILTGMAQRIGSEQLIQQFNELLDLVQAESLATSAVITRSNEYVQENLDWLSVHGDIISSWLVENF